MTKFLAIANWKANFTFEECAVWVQQFNKLCEEHNFNNVLPIICPSHVHLNYVKDHLTKKAAVGAQNVSVFESGPHTGEVSVYQIKKFASYCIVGHSERRKEFNEADKDVQVKVQNCLKAHVTPIVCISSANQLDLLRKYNKIVVAFEPLEAIGSGNPESPADVADIAKAILQINKEFTVIYGGSVDKENISNYIRIPGISGVLIGTESLSPVRFFELCKTSDM